MNAALRKIGALTSKDFADLLKNPSTAICALLPVGFMLLYKYGMAENLTGENGIHFLAFLAATAACMTSRERSPARRAEAAATDASRALSALCDTVAVT